MEDTSVDNWYGVQDPRRRKKIQDRLAQRARRKRLAEQNDQLVTLSSESLHNVEGNDESQACLLSELHSLALAWPSGEESSYSSGDSSVSYSLDADPTALVCPMTIDQKAFPTPQLSMFSALWDNGTVLGLSCCCGFTAKSKQVSADVPLSLHPTPTQLTKIHFTWIDRFPFPKMRDNMILLSGAFDEEDFLEDLFKQESFAIIPGMMSWDPTAWRVGHGFGQKWRYLFY